jgi:hypothetical protein
MKAATLPLAVSLVLLSLSSGAGAHPASAQTGDARLAVLSADAREAAKIVDAFHAALARGEPGAAAGLLDDSALIFEEGEAELSKAAYVASHMPADIAYLAAVRETVSQRTGGAAGGLAWIASQGRAEGRYHDRAVSRRTTETVILRRTAQGWRIVHAHWSSRAAPPPGP